MVERSEPIKHLIDKAMALRAKGLNCSQCVAAVFADRLNGITPEALEAMTSGLGGGICGRGNLCGVVSAMTIVAGNICYCPSSDPNWKPSLYARVRKLADEFEAKEGSVECHDLKGKLRRSCPELIADGIEMLYNFIETAKTE